MKVFIDTNVLLDIYHLSGADLDVLRTLIKLMGKNKIDLLVSQQVIDEFWRNREGVIADALKIFRDTKADAKLPNIVRSYPEAVDLKSAIDKVAPLVKQLSNTIMDDIKRQKLKADQIMKELFAAAVIGEITSHIIKRAKLRVELGNPPGKKGSLGDAINWEWLLEQEVNFFEDELIIISSDGDFESELIANKPKEFLLREWNAKNENCELLLMKSLQEFMKSKFPNIQMADEVDKMEAIDGLAYSRSFANTHFAISQLDQYDDFKDHEVKRILETFQDNNQVSWILSDDDVLAFAKKILPLAKSEETKSLAALLNEDIKRYEDVDL